MPRRGSRRQLPSEPARNAASTAMLSASSTWERTSHPWWWGRDLFRFYPQRICPARIHSNPGRVENFHTLFSLFSTFLAVGPNPIYLRRALSQLIFGQIPPWCESIQLGSAPCGGLEWGGEGGSVCGKGQGGLQIRADMAWHFGRIF